MGQPIPPRLYFYMTHHPQKMFSFRVTWFLKFGLLDLDPLPLAYFNSGEYHSIKYRMVVSSQHWESSFMSFFLLSNDNTKRIYVTHGVFPQKNVTKTGIYWGSYRMHIFVFLAHLWILLPHVEILFCINHYLIVCKIKWCTSSRVNYGF